MRKSSQKLQVMQCYKFGLKVFHQFSALKRCWTFCSKCSNFSIDHCIVKKKLIYSKSRFFNELTIWCVNAEVLFFVAICCTLRQIYLKALLMRVVNIFASKLFLEFIFFFLPILDNYFNCFIEAFGLVE